MFRCSHTIFRELIVRGWCDCTETCRSYFNVNFNIVLRLSLVHSLVNKNFDIIKMRRTKVKITILWIATQQQDIHFHLSGWTTCNSLWVSNFFLSQRGSY